MHHEYAQLASLSQADFKKKMASCFNKANATKSDAADLKRIERLLDLRPGILANESFYVSKKTCSCGRTLTFYDFVLSSLVDSLHSKSFVAHTLLGNKYFIQPPRSARCSSCGDVHTLDYETDTYGCCN